MGHQNSHRSRRVRVLLEGGHALTLAPPVDFDLLADEIWTQTSGAPLIEFCDEAGRRSVLRKTAVVGLVGEEEIIAAYENMASSPPFELIEDFLAPAEYAEVLNYTIGCESKFEKSKVTSGRVGYRKSTVLFDTGLIYSLFIERLTDAWENLVSKNQFGGIRPDFEKCEIQITASGHEDFFRLHDDRSSAEARHREITFVYYYSSNSEAFFGGDLRLYNDTLNDFHLVQPINNSMILFPSRVQHEVLPVFVPSRAFRDSRFTINGWLRALNEGK